MGAWEEFITQHPDVAELEDSAAEVEAEIEGEDDDDTVGVPYPKITSNTLKSGDVRVHLTFTKEQFNALVSAVTHLEDHQCGWGESVILTFYEGVLFQVGEEFFG